MTAAAKAAFLFPVHSLGMGEIKPGDIQLVGGVIAEMEGTLPDAITRVTCSRCRRTSGNGEPLTRDEAIVHVRLHYAKEHPLEELPEPFTPDLLPVHDEPGLIYVVTPPTDREREFWAPVTEARRRRDDE